MSYTVLARRYRSDTFDDVVGQEAISTTLKNAIASDRVSHAYLFTGTRGVGKTTMARILAKALNCQSFDAPTTQPCCKCASCLAISRGDDIDVLEIDGASNNGVENIRELRQNAIYRPARSRFKIYIIDEIHMLSPGAFNALLKTLEEPPAHVKFIFATTEANKILPTILSRCQRFDFRNIKVEDIARHLQAVLAGEKVEAEEAFVRRVARLAGGSMRDALSLLDQMMSMSSGKLTLQMLADLMGVARSDRVIALAQAIGQGNLSEALNQVDIALSEGLALDRLAEAMQNHFRDLMILNSCSADTDLVDLTDQATREQMTAQAGMFDNATLVYYITITEQLRRDIKAGIAGRPLLEAAIVRLTDNERFSDTKALLEQLQNMPSGSPGPAAMAQPVNNSVAAGRSVQRGGVPVQPADSVPSQASAGITPEQKVEFPAELTVQYIKQNWQRILELLVQKHGRAQEIYLKPAEPLDWRDNTLVIGYHKKDGGLCKALESMPDSLNNLQKAMSQILGRQITLVPRHIDDNIGDKEELFSDDTDRPAKAAGAAKMPPGAKPSQKEINAAVNDPHVKQVQEVLGGKVLHVERLK